jgi:hypothetical protein
LPLLSQHHSTAAPSAKRYDKRYEKKGWMVFHPLWGR